MKTRNILQGVLLCAAFMAGAMPAFAANCSGGTNNKAKISQAGTNTIFQEGAPVTISANLPASNPSPPVGQYSWSQVSGPAVTLSPSTGTSTTFITPHVTSGHSAVLVLRLTVTGATCTGAVPASEDISLNLANINNYPPVAVASASAASVTAGTQVFLSSAGSYDPDSDPIVFSWTQLAGPAVTLVGGNTASASFTAPAVAATTTLRFRLTVTENMASALSGSATVDVNVVVNNAPPVAGLGCPTSVNEGQLLTLDGSASSDPENGPLTYAWTQLSGFPLATLPAAPYGSTVTFTAPALGVGQPGLLQFGLTVTDNDNASSSADCSLFVNDVTAPVLSGAVDLIKEATSAAGAVASYTVTAYDNVVGPSLAICDPVSGSTFPIGVSTVSCSQTDASGNTGADSFTVTVSDTQAPDIVPPPAQTFEATAALTPLSSVDYGTPTITDAVGVTEQSNDAPTLFPLGDTSITWYAKDFAGNSATAFTVITVQDTSAPVLTLPADITTEASNGSGAVVTFSATAADLVDGAVTVNCTPASGSTFALGSTAVSCSATDNAGNPANAGFSVTVVDTTPPALTLPSNLIVEASGPAGAVATFSATASDLVDGIVAASCNPTSGSTFAIGSRTVDCSATDAAGNTANGSFVVTVEDTTPPVLTLPGDITVEATSGSGAVVTFSATAADLVDGALTVACTPVSGSTFALGAHSVDCSATDNAGNAANGSFSVTVVDTTPPVLTLPNDLTVEATGPAGAVASFSATASDLVDGIVAVSCNPASGSTFALGATTVSCSATDTAGNTANGSFAVSVQDTTGPAISAHADVTAIAAANSKAFVTYTLPTASDLVDGARPVTCLPASGSEFGIGATTVNCSSSDTRGNASQSSFKVIVSFAWSGFFSPVDNLPTLNLVKSGSAIPVKFSLGGSQGLAIFATGYPRTVQVSCSTGTPQDVIEETVTAGGSTLSYGSGQYVYVWKTEKTWVGTCRQLQVKLTDGSEHVANFSFK